MEGVIFHFTLLSHLNKWSPSSHCTRSCCCSFFLIKRYQLVLISPLLSKSLALCVFFFVSEKKNAFFSFLIMMMLRSDIHGRKRQDRNWLWNGREKSSFHLFSSSGFMQLYTSSHFNAAVQLTSNNVSFLRSFENYEETSFCYRVTRFFKFLNFLLAFKLNILAIRNWKFKVHLSCFWINFNWAHLQFM